MQTEKIAQKQEAKAQLDAKLEKTSEKTCKNHKNCTKQKRGKKHESLGPAL
jgi:hypothetical protein